MSLLPVVLLLDFVGTRHFHIVGRHVETVGVRVVPPRGVGPQVFRHVQSLLHEAPRVELEPSTRLFLYEEFGPERVALLLDFNRDLLVRGEFAEILAEDGAPALEVDDPQTRKLQRDELVDELLEEGQVEGEVAFLGDPPVPPDYLGVIVEERREAARIVQDHDLVAPEPVVLVLEDPEFGGEVGEVHPVGVALEGGDVPVVIHLLGPRNVALLDLVTVKSSFVSGGTRGTGFYLSIVISSMVKINLKRRKKTQSDDMTGESALSLKQKKPTNLFIQK
jgi:hypothetical protein